MDSLTHKARSAAKRLFSSQANERTTLYAVGGLRIYETQDPDFARQVLKWHKNFPMPSFVRGSLEKLIGKSLIVDEGESWSLTHAALKPLFSKGAIGTKIMPMLVDQCEEMIDRWLKTPHPVDLEAEMRDLTGRTIMKVIFGDGISQTQAAAVIEATSVEIDTFNPTSPYMLVSAASRIFNRPYDLISEPKGEVLRALETANGVYQDIIDERRKLDTQPSDVLGVLIDMKTPEGKPLTDAQIKDQLRMFVFAGHETTAVGLTNTIHELLKPENAPELQKIKDETARVLGRQAMEPKHYDQLPVSRAAFREGLRIHPSAHRIAREALDDMQLKNIQVRGGDLVWIDVLAMHHDAGLWPTPEQFSLDRFSGKPDLNAFLPFGAGARQCLGGVLAIEEGMTVLASIFNKVAPQKMGKGITGHINGVTRRPKDKLFLHVRQLTK